MVINKGRYLGKSAQFSGAYFKFSRLFQVQKLEGNRGVAESVEPDLVSDNLLVRLFATAQTLLFYRFKAEIGKFFASVAFQNWEVQGSYALKSCIYLAGRNPEMYNRNRILLGPKAPQIVEWSLSR